MGKVAKLKTCMIVQETEPEFWQFTEDSEKDTVKQAANGNLQPLMQLICTRMSKANILCVEMHGILHDKDSKTAWDEASKQNVIIQKARHIHIVCKFAEGYGGTLAAIADAAGVLPQFIEKPQKGRFAYDNMLAYLVHAKYTDKYQYNPADVQTVLVNIPDNIPDDKMTPPLAALIATRKNSTTAKAYTEIYAERRDDWIKARASIKCKSAALDVDWVEEQILTGQLTKSEIMLTDGLYDIYARNKRRIDDALATYGERKAYKTIQALQNGEFKLTVFFITGKSGSGKTRFASEFVNRLCDENEGWQVCYTAASNPVDDYRGEEILVMDDVRGSAMSASDWLKLLDPYNVTPSSARYHNKTVAARVIIITSEKAPIEFFYYVRSGGGNRSEALDQFIRRLEACVHVINYTATNGEDVTAYTIQHTERSDRPMVCEVPNSPIAGSGLNATVTLNYGFKSEITTDKDTAINNLCNKVDANNHKGD